MLKQFILSVVLISSACVSKELHSETGAQSNNERCTARCLKADSAILCDDPEAKNWCERNCDGYKSPENNGDFKIGEAYKTSKKCSTHMKENLSIQSGNFFNY